MGAPINMPPRKSKEEIAQERLRADITAGQGLAKELIPEGAAGRVEEGRSADVQSVIERRKAALEGMSSEEMQARRAGAAEAINRQSETTRRRLAAVQAAQGVRGGVAAAGQLAAIQQGAQQRAAFERDMLIQDAQMRRDALSAFESSVTAAEADERSRSLFNIQQRAREQAGRLEFSVGFGSILSGERSSAEAAEAQRRSAAAASAGCFAEGSLVETAYGLERIENLRIGDDLKTGSIYSLMVTAAPEEDMFNYQGVVVSGSHLVHEGGRMIRVRNSKFAERTEFKGILYNLGTSDHRIVINGITFGDVDETDHVEAIDAAYEEAANNYMKSLNGVF